MKQIDKIYLNGEWVVPRQPQMQDIVNPATEQVIGQVALASVADVDRAVAAARAVFESWSQTTREERLALLDRIIELYDQRMEEMAQVISAEMRAPMSMARDSQAPF